MKAIQGAAEAACLIAGYAIWSSAFVALYALHGAACGGGLAWEPHQLRAALFAIFAAHMLAHGGLIAWFAARLARTGPPEARFLRRASFILAIAAAASTLWTSAPIAFLSICR